MISSFLITAKLYGICILVLPLHCNYIVCLKFFRLWILLLRQALISKSGTGWVHLVERFTVCWVQVHKRFSFKVEKFLKGSLNSILLPSPSVKIQIMGGKVCLRCKDKTLLDVVNKLLKTISLLTSPSNVLPYCLK